MEPQLPIQKPTPVRIKYELTFHDGRVWTDVVELDPETLEHRQDGASELPEWTRLSYHQCPNCPLSTDERERCPAAVSLVDVVETFQSNRSFEKVHVKIHTRERNFHKEAALQSVLGSLSGVYMATSGCPILARVRPLVRYHLPFSNIAETQFRVLSMYLLAQHLRSRRGMDADWGLEGLGKLYEDIERVNRHFAKRLQALGVQDAGPNAIALLSTLGQSVQLALDEDFVAELERLFEPLLTPENSSPSASEDAIQADGPAGQKG